MNIFLISLILVFEKVVIMLTHYTITKNDYDVHELLSADESDYDMTTLITVLSCPDFQISFNKKILTIIQCVSEMVFSGCAIRKPKMSRDNFL